jgi:hypothetical protein
MRPACRSGQWSLPCTEGGDLLPASTNLPIALLRLMLFLLLAISLPLFCEVPFVWEGGRRDSLLAPSCLSRAENQQSFLFLSCLPLA